MKYPKKSRNVKTVGGLIKQLEKLPKNMPVRGTFGEPVYVQVYNYSDSAKECGLDIHCSIEDGDK